MATDVLLRNTRKTEHILLCLISICYLLLFAEEYVRNQVSIDYSPVLSSVWLSSTGIIIPGLCFHFLIRFSKLERSMPRYIYPYVFYLPVVFVAVNLLTGADLIAAQQFVEAGYWKLPVYNEGYYIAMTGSILMDMVYLIPLFIARSRSHVPEQRSIYLQLAGGIIIAIVWHVVFGYFNYGDSLPPYPYLYSGIIWCYFLRRTMKKHDLLNLYDKRFEKLFNLNPDAIMLLDSNGIAKNANPGARKLFQDMELGFVRIYDLLDHDIKGSIRAKEQMNQLETEIWFKNRRWILLVNADYVWVDNEMHVLLVLRDITAQKEHQEEIQFLAYHDPLTRLPNRRYFYEQLTIAMQQAAKNHETLALLLVDLDKIKLLNDHYGHFAGDEALQKAAQVLQETVDGQGVVARMGGDEFILFIRHSPTPQIIEHKMTLMQQRFGQYMAKYKPLPMGLSLSVGASYYPADGTDGQALINAADAAMFEMKRGRAPSVI